MKKQIAKKGIRFISIALLFVMAITSCKKDEDKETFQLPPESSFVMDLSQFDQSATKSSRDLNLVGSKNNVFLAASKILFWNTTIAIVMAVPVASFKEAFNHDPVRVSNEEWKWSYNVTVNDTVYTVELHGIVLENSDIKWEMYISKEDGFQNFLWYEGICNVQRTEGTWTLYESPANNVEWLEIEWEHNWGQKTGEIRYTCVKDGDAAEGNSITYGLNNVTVYNSYYIIYVADGPNLTEINYNTTTHEGRITYGNTTLCWDSEYNDTDCE